MSTRVFLSGGEVPRFYKCMTEMKCKSVLMTYWTLRKNPDYIKQCKKKFPDIDIMVDSGAFHFFNKKVQPISFYENYCKRYVKFLKKYSEYIFCAAELDIDTLIGRTLPQKWREGVFNDLNKKYMPIIYVWHDGDPVDRFKEYCQAFDFVGISSDFKGNYATLTSIARQYLAKVHVFGYTRSTEIQDYDFYSVDSTTWLLGSKYGETDVFNGKTISRYDNSKKAMRQRYRNKFQAAGLDWNKISQEEYYEVIKMNMLAFIEMEEYLGRANRNKSYWRFKLPRPAQVKKFNEEQVDRYLALHKWKDEELKALAPDEKLMRLTLFSRLQHNQLTRIQEWVKNNNADDTAIVFTDDAAEKLKDKSNPSIEDIDAMRRQYNLGLLGSSLSLKRSQNDFAPTKPVKRRPPEGEEIPREPKELEGVNLYYE